MGWLSMKKILLRKIYDSFKPVFYNKELLHYSKGESIDVVFLFTDGIAWTYPSSDNGEGTAFWHIEHREKSQFFGEEFLVWALKPSSIDMDNLWVCLETSYLVKIEIFLLKVL